MKNFNKLSPESQKRVREVALNLITRHALKTGATREQALARAKKRVADLIFKPPTKFFEPPKKTTK